jgi:mRNA interferase RelE/StbE
LKDFSIVISNRVARNIRRLPKNVQKRIANKIGLIPIQPQLLDIKKMVGMEDTYRLRVGDYRILFLIDFEKKLVKISDINTRGRAY